MEITFYLIIHLILFISAIIMLFILKIGSIMLSMGGIFITVMNPTVEYYNSTGFIEKQMGGEIGFIAFLYVVIMLIALSVYLKEGEV